MDRETELITGWDVEVNIVESNPPQEEALRLECREIPEADHISLDVVLHRPPGPDCATSTSS